MRLILYLLSLIYGIIVSLRNLLFDYNILKSKKHKIPIICIGNLSLGGSGKTPHTQYIAKLFSKTFNIAIISRGYGRKKKGFHYVELDSSAINIGDEPLLLKQDNSSCIVAVNKNRNKAVEKILNDYPQTNLILLDDGFQHRHIKKSINILTTPFQKPFTKDNLIPLGRLREHKKQALRANIIIVSNSPRKINLIEKKEIIQSFNLKKYQKLYFSSIKYCKFKCLKNNTDIKNEKDYIITLVTGIANPKNLLNYLEKTCRKVNFIRFSDHHNYTSKDIKNILLQHNKEKSLKKLILTTEKDAVKLKSFLTHFKEENIYYIPIHIYIHNKDMFQKELLNYVKRN